MEEEITYGEFKKYMQSLIEAQLRELYLLTEDYRRHNAVDDITAEIDERLYAKIESLTLSIEHNRQLLREGEIHKDDALFFLKDGVPTYQVVGKELKQRHERRMKISELSYA